MTISGPSRAHRLLQGWSANLFQMVLGISEILERRNAFRLADHLRGGHADSGCRWRPAWMVAEPLPLFQAAR
jgi:hypothetical protein